VQWLDKSLEKGAAQFSSKLPGRITLHACHCTPNDYRTLSSRLH
jgi:hypothetical protein